MTRDEHPARGLQCSVVNCGQPGWVISGRDGRILCEDCWSYLEDPSVRGGSGFVEWLGRILRGGGRGA